MFEGAARGPPRAYSRARRGRLTLRSGQPPPPDREAPAPGRRRPCGPPPLRALPAICGSPSGRHARRRRGAGRHGHHQPGARDCGQEPRQLQALRDLRDAAPGQEGMGRGPRAVSAHTRFCGAASACLRDTPPRLPPPRECPGVFLWAQAALAVAVQRQVSAPHAFAARRGHDLEPGRGGQGAGSLRAVPRGVQTGRRRGGRQEQALEAGVLPPVPARSAAAATAITLSPLPASRCRAPACPAKGDRASCARAPAKRLPAQEALLVTASAPRPRAMLRGR